MICVLPFGNYLRKVDVAITSLFNPFLENKKRVSSAVGELLDEAILGRCRRLFKGNLRLLFSKVYL